MTPALLTYLLGAMGFKVWRLQIPLDWAKQLQVFVLQANGTSKMRNPK
jgi:hypothetical protein